MKHSRESDPLDEAIRKAMRHCRLLPEDAIWNSQIRKFSEKLLEIVAKQQARK